MIEVESSYDPMPVFETEGQSAASTTKSFGPFTLDLTERRLERDGRPVPLASRAIDILIILVERAGTVVGKSELLARVWPRGTVDDGSLRVYVAALRKVLGDGRGGARYVATISGQGYCFVARIWPAGSLQRLDAPVSGSIHNLPSHPVKMIGRNQTVSELSDQIVRERFVSLVGPGGIGKTTVAVSAGYALLDKFVNAVYFFDLGALHDPALVPNVIASTLGLLGISQDPVDGLVSFLRDKRILLILDCCEHVVETAAALAERLCKEAPQLHILATSREALRVEGEYVHRLPPLAVPSDDTALTAEQALGFSAIQLFVERAAASNGQFQLTDANAPLVGEICRRLDGIALAIELASSRAGAYSLRETISLLSERFKLLWEGRRTALPRHQTLRATLDWSYNLLSEHEALVFRRLSVFAGTFTLDAACEVAEADEDGGLHVEAALESLVRKSLLSATPGRGPARYRLLDTTRSYSADQLHIAGETEAMAQRHASYFSDLLEQLNGDQRRNAEPSSFAAIADEFGNTRSALTWCFGGNGNISTGVALAAASMPMFLQLSLLAECQLWARCAIDHLEVVEFNRVYDLGLHAALGLAMMHTRGNTEEVHACFTRALGLAEQIDNVPEQLRMIERLHPFHMRRGNYAEALAYAERGNALAAKRGNTIQQAHMEIAFAMSCFLAGKAVLARSSVESGLRKLPKSQPGIHDQLNFDYPSRGRITLARILWIQGYTDQAIAMARQALDEVIRLGHPVKLSMAIVWSFSIFLWNQEPDGFEGYVNRLILEADKHSLGPYKAVGEGIKGVVLIAQGQVESGLLLLQRTVQEMRKQSYRVHADISFPLAEALMMVGNHQEALVAIDEARSEAACVSPEVLRIRADVLLSGANPDFTKAERCLRTSLRLARRQSALSWELKTATSLAKLWNAQGRHDDARGILAPVYARLTEGFDSRGVKTARELLDILNSTRQNSCVA